MFVESSQFESFKGHNPEFVRRVWKKRRIEAEQQRLADRERFKARIAELHDQGKSQHKIAQVLNVTLGVVAGEVRRLNQRRKWIIDLPCPAWVKTIIAETCRQHGLSPQGALKRCSREAAPCKREILFKVRHHPKEPSFPKIARWFDLNHATVLYAVRKHAASLDQHNQ